MPYVLPTFVSRCDVFTSGATYPARPVYTNVPCQVYAYSRQDYSLNSWALIRFPVDRTKPLAQSMVIRIMPHTAGDVVYSIQLPLWMHRGFANEYWQAQCSTLDDVTLASALRVP